MVSKTVKINHVGGIHMRPSMYIADAANIFNSSIILIKEGEEPANAKSVMELTMLAVKEGDEVTITANGNDEEEAVQIILHLIENDFDNKCQKAS